MLAYLQNYTVGPQGREVMGDKDSNIEGFAGFNILDKDFLGCPRFNLQLTFSSKLVFQLGAVH